MKKETFLISGMSCSACSAAVERAVSKLNGIKKAEVNLLANSMYTEFSEDLLSVEDIISAVTDAGYKAEVKNNAIKSTDANLKKKAEKIKFQLILSTVFLIALMFISMGDMVGLTIIPHDKAVLKGIIEFSLLIPILILNRRYFYSGFKSLFALNPNMDTLISIGALASAAFSIWQIIKGGAHHYYFESAGMILTFITIGKYLESKSKAKTTDAVTKLMDLSPKTSIVLRDGVETEIDSKDIVKGDIVIVKSGMIFPADGKATEGTGYADESAITGESTQVKKNKGTEITGGTILTSGYIKFTAEKVGEETTLAGIIKLVEEATLTKPKIQKFADKISHIFVPIVIAIAIITFVIWYMITGDFERSLSFAVSVLVISCPCALGLATPTAIMVGTGRAAELGILIKNAEVYEVGSKITTVMLDKTGTITEGKPVVTDVISDDDNTDSILQICAKIESMSDHPLAQAIASHKTFDTTADIYNFSSVTGEGVSADFEGYNYKIGKKSYVTNTDISNFYLKAENDLTSKGKTAVFVSKSNKIIAVIGIADTVKVNSKEAVSSLNRSKINTIMITGDNELTAQAIGNEVGIKEIYSELLPADKNNIIKEHQKRCKVAMIGDGINDTPALATADVGIALGAGTDIAMESADIVLIKNDLRDVHTTLEICKKVMRNIKENLFWALCYNLICIPVAAGLLYYPLGLSLSPMIGTATMSLSSICVISNALRLKRIKRQYTTTERIEKKMKTVNIEGMACPHCQARVQTILSAFDPEVQVDHVKGTAVISDDVDNQAIIDAVTNGGYKVTSIE